LNDLLREIRLPNGLAVSFFDKTSHYYGGFFHVSILVEIEFEISPGLSPVGLDYEEAKSLLGDRVRHQQTLDRMGVRNDEADSVKKLLIEHFVETLMNYLADPAFPSRIIAAEMLKAGKLKKSAQLRFARA